MPRRRADQEPVEPSRRYEFGDPGGGARIAPGFATACLGGFALLVTLASWSAPLGWVAWFDLPLAFVLFLIGAWVALTDPRRSTSAVPGLLAGAAAVVIALIHLFAARGHPWLR